MPGSLPNLKVSVKKEVYSEFFPTHCSKGAAWEASPSANINNGKILCWSLS